MTLAQAMCSYINGDNSSFPSVYEAVKPYVRKLLRSFFHDEGIIDDLTQDVFTKAHRARFRFDQKRITDSLVFGWYVGIARNTAIDQFRQNQHRSEKFYQFCRDHEFCDQILHLQETIEDLERKAVAAEIINSSLMKLSSRQRSVVRRHKLDGIPFVELAKELGEHRSTLRVRAHRAMAKLRTELEHEF